MTGGYASDSNWPTRMGRTSLRAFRSCLLISRRQRNALAFGYYARLPVLH